MADSSRDPPDPTTLTRLLREVRSGDSDASASLMSLAYAELGDLARAHLRRERRGHTLQPTALVHEAWFRMAPQLDQAEDRLHFFAIASRAMRRVLTDHARRRNRDKREGQRLRIELDGSIGSEDPDGIDLVDLDDSLSRLATLNARHARVVELRIFAGFTIAEVAETLEVSHTTIETDWFTAKAWLRTELDAAG